MKVNVKITLKDGVLDPQGAAVHAALTGLNFTSVQNVRIGKSITLDVDAPSTNLAKEQVEEMCKALLVNSVIETYEISVE